MLSMFVFENTKNNPDNSAHLKSDKIWQEMKRRRLRLWELVTATTATTTFAHSKPASLKRVVPKLSFFPLCLIISLLVCCNGQSVESLTNNIPTHPSTATLTTTSTRQYYMRPSQYLRRYFKCRYALKQAMGLFSGAHNVQSSDNEPNEDMGALADVVVRSLDNTDSEQKQKLAGIGILAPNKRSSSRSCKADCDAFVLWPETPTGTVQEISCTQLLTAAHYQHYNTHNNVDDHFRPSSSSPGTSSSGEDDLVELEQQFESDQHFSLHSFMLPANRLADANITRRCSNGEWEEFADYGACGLDPLRLRPLSTYQLEKIYDIREKMITAKFTRVLGSERAFVRCVDDVLSTPVSTLTTPYCGRTFDGWSCFNDTPADSVVWFQCPDFIYGFNPQNKAHKTCTAEGQWAVHRDTLAPWTNYTSCVDFTDYHFRNMIIKLHIIGYSISLAALLISLSIFLTFKVLSSQTRIRIHKNFFVSFIINNFMWIIWYFAITDQNILFENGFYCQALHVLLHYFLVCNYFWMFCEGLYLHTILVVAFVSEERILKWFYLIGWGMPMLFAAAYAFFRAKSADTLNCWIDESKYTWILNMPVLLSFLLNIFFLINIVRVLVTKLQAVNTADAHQTRKAVRATLILIPLLGLHFILTPFRPESNSSAAQAYEVFSAIVSSLQGFCVSMLFCFFNGEVLAQVKKRWNQYLLVHGIGAANNRRMSSYAGTQVSIRLANNSSNNNFNNSESGRRPDRCSPTSPPRHGTIVDCETARLHCSPSDEEQREMDKLTYNHLLDCPKN